MIFFENKTNESYGQKLVKGTIIVLFFSVLSMLLGFFVKFLMARLINVDSIGLFFSVLGFISFWTFLRDFGLSDSLIYFIPKFLVDNNKANIKKIILLTLRVQIFFGLVFFVLFSLFSNLLAKYYFKNQDATLLLIFLGFYFFLDGFHEVLMRIFLGYKKYFYTQSIDFLFQFLANSFIVFVLLFYKNVVFFGLSYIVAEIFCIILFYNVFIKKVFPDFHKINVKYDKKFSKKAFKFSLPTMIATIGELSYAQQTIFFLTIFSGLESVGFYVMLNSLAKLSVFLYKATSRVFAPLISEMWKKQEFKKLNFYFKENFLISYIFALPIIFSFVFLPEIAINLVYGEVFVRYSKEFIFVALAFLFQLICSIYNHLSVSIGKPYLYKNNVFVKFFFNLVLNIILIPKIGLFGAIVSDFVSIIIATLHILYFSLKEVKLSIPIKEILILFFSNIIFVFFVNVFRNLLNIITIFGNLFIKTFFVFSLSLLIYFFVLFFMGIISIKKIRVIFGI